MGRGTRSRAPPRAGDTGSWSTSAPNARTSSNVVSRSSERKRSLQRSLRHERQEGVALGLRTTAVRLEQNDVDVLAQEAGGPNGSRRTSIRIGGETTKRSPTGIA